MKFCVKLLIHYKGSKNNKTVYKIDSICLICILAMYYAILIVVAAAIL
jgi:hypothetical protein